MNPFHLAIVVRDLAEARDFYSNVLGCKEGRSDSTWVDFDFYGHQLACHLNPEVNISTVENPVDGHGVPVPHFGIVLDMDEWLSVSERLKKENISFVIEPTIRFKGKPGEQGTMFFRDPSGNAIEIKGFNDIEAQLFNKHPMS